MRITDPKIKENANVSLHDCRTNKIELDGQSIKFFIPDGFYLIHDREYPLGTENYNAEVTCHFYNKDEDRFSVSVYRKNIFGQTIREDRTDQFVKAVNSGKIEFEFVYTFQSYHSVLFKGYIWRKRKPWWRECEIELLIDEITYNWSVR